MTELKTEVIRLFAAKIQNISDERTLRIIFDFLNGIDSDDRNGIILSHHYDTIKAKYGSVLKKLAE